LYNFACKKYSPFRVSMCISRVFCELALKEHCFLITVCGTKQPLYSISPGLDGYNSKTVSCMHMLLPSNCWYIRILLGKISLLLLGANLMVYFRSKLTTKVRVFISSPKIDIYDVTYLRTVKRCKYDTLHTLPPIKGLSRVLILKLQLQVVLRELKWNRMQFCFLWKVSICIPHLLRYVSRHIHLSFPPKMYWYMVNNILKIQHCIPTLLWNNPVSKYNV
jgi:hypothetical protein